jgi:hypothetical protein
MHMENRCPVAAWHSRSRAARTCLKPAAVTLSGEAADLLTNEDMQRAYLGSAVRV